MDRIAEKARTNHYRKGEFLFRSQEREGALYIVNRGKVHIYRLSDTGKEQLIRILNPGDFTGEWTLFNPDALHEEYAEATRDTSVCMIQQKDIQVFLEEVPGSFVKTARRNVATIRTFRTANRSSGSRTCGHPVDFIFGRKYRV